MNENTSIPMSEWEWDQVTEDHAACGNNNGRDAAIKEEGKREAFASFYEDRHQKRKDNTAVSAAKYAVGACVLAALCGIVRTIPWLAVAFGLVAFALSLIAAYGAGKYSEM